MFWTDWGRKPKIESAWMDGQHREVLLDEDLGWPTGLALDYLNENRIYWCDSKENIIESMKADGSDRQMVISGGETPERCVRRHEGLSFSRLLSLQTSVTRTVWMCLRDMCTGPLKKREKCGRKISLVKEIK